MPINLFKLSFPMPIAKNEFQILNLHPKNMYFKNKSTRFFNAYLLDHDQL